MRECVHIFVNMAFPDVVPHPGSERAQTALTSVNERVRYKLSHHVVTGLPVPTSLPPGACRQLMKGVPGIKQGGRLFYKTIKGVLVANDYLVHPADACVFIRQPTPPKPALQFAALAVWVDDVFAVVKNKLEWEVLLKVLRSAFTVTDKGDVSMFLGMEIHQSPDRSSITLSQRISIDNLLSRVTSSCSHPLRRWLHLNQS